MCIYHSPPGQTFATDNVETQPQDVMQMSPPPLPAPSPLSPEVPATERRANYQNKGAHDLSATLELGKTGNYSDQEKADDMKRQDMPGKKDECEKVEASKVKVKKDQEEQEQFTQSETEATSSYHKTQSSA